MISQLPFHSPCSAAIVLDHKYNDYAEEKNIRCNNIHSSSEFADLYYLVFWWLFIVYHSNALGFKLDCFTTTFNRIAFLKSDFMILTCQLMSMKRFQEAQRKNQLALN